MRGTDVKRFLKAAFPRRVRAALYGAGYAALVALVASGELPAWVLAPGSPLMLAILNLTPADVEDQEDPEP